ncbi:hypothetical protein EV356DRAFT_568620 [Viridothelium virens]|uniref:Prion-inhibition and propagation HeLo domain-containing protein n=1 Tax=Viridothelium virens TaxID=1048519 RepID=A0A6A6H488_VIRVR|nr:hypothetical protein EV356DRAFT_568620 [Viridothelium virens]
MVLSCAFWRQDGEKSRKSNDCPISTCDKGSLSVDLANPEQANYFVPASRSEHFLGSREVSKKIAMWNLRLAQQKELQHVWTEHDWIHLNSRNECHNSACRDRYIFFTTVKSAEKESLIQLRELDIQQSILKAWGFYWDIQRHETIVGRDPALSNTKKGKLSKYLERNVYKADGMINALCAISEILSNRDKLIKRYGLNLKPVKEKSLKEIQGDVAELQVDGSAPASIQAAAINVRHRLSAISKCRWAIKDRDDFRRLITDLKSYNDALYRLCPDGAFDAMNITLTLDYLSKQESLIGLRRTLTLTNELLKGDKTAPSRGGLEMLASAAAFKTKTVKLRTSQSLPEPETTIDMIDPRKVKYLNQNLALWNGKIVYIERKSYRKIEEADGARHGRHMRRTSRSPSLPSPVRSEEYDDPPHVSIYEDMLKDNARNVNIQEDILKYDQPDLNMREDILKLCRTLHNVQERENFLALKLIGVVDHTRGHCISLVYELPGNLGTPSRSIPAADTKSRAPRPLTRLQYGGKNYLPNIAPLGIRFELARKVFNAVVFLHASGWLHKNIRTNSVIVFRQLHQHGRKDDLHDPYLGGYNFSRSDDVKEDEKSTKELEDGSESGSELDTEADLGPRMYSRRFNELRLDHYHHPDKRASPRRMYRHAYDVYSLGIVLLEIGFWSRLESIREDYDDNGYKSVRSRVHFPEDPYEFRRFVVENYLDKLRFTCGDVYADVVYKCLMVNATDSEIGEASQRELCARVAADLSGCRA